MAKRSGSDKHSSGSPPGNEKRESITFQQIADLAKVSLGTVSNVLNGNVSVSESRKKRVMDAVQALGYQRNQLARWMRQNSTNIIGMLIPDIGNPFFPAIVRGAEDIAYKHNYSLILCNTDDDPQKEAYYLKELSSVRPAGLLIVPTADTTVIRSVGPPNAAITFVDRCPEEWSGDSVTADNADGAYQVARHLLELGHRKLAVITGPSHLSTVNERLSGFQRALSEAGIPLTAGYIHESRFNTDGGYTAAMRLLKMLPRPTAIFASNDLLASGCLTAAQSLGLRCPEDLSLVGFDNLEFVEHTAPPLTTVHQPGYQIGETACRVLIERITHPELQIKRIVLPTELKIRNSTTSPASTPEHKRAKRKK